MSEQTPQGDSPSVEDRIEAMMFGDEPQEEAQEAPADDGGEQADAEQPPAAEALETVEYEGKQYQVPPELKPALQRQADYTRKTQEVAEMRRAAEMREHAARERAEFEQSVAPELEQMRALDAQLSQYKSLDWASLDTDQLVRARHAMDQIRDQKQQIESQVNAKQQQFGQHLEQRFIQAVAQTEAFMGKAVPGWNEQSGKELTEYMRNAGFSPAAIRSIVTDPVQTHLLWKAQQFDKLQAQKPAAQERASKAPPIVKAPSTDPAMQQKMQNLNWKKQMKNTTDPRVKRALIEQRLERML